MLTIAYGGTLQHFSPQIQQKTTFDWLKQWIWTYKGDFVDSSTRSGYFILQALKYLKEHFKVSENDILLNLWGMIEAGNQKQAEQLGIADLVKIEGYFNKSDSMAKLNEADILFLPLERGKNGMKTLFIPGKLYEYLLLGKPILALTEDSDCKDIIVGSGLGIVVAPDDSQAIATTLYQFIENKELLKQYQPNHDFIQQYSAESMTKKVVKVFDEMLGVNG